MPAFQGSSDSEFPVVGMKDNQEKAGDNESEFEFEYDPTETETFYVDIDLSTVNGGRREPPKRKWADLQSANDEEAVSESEQNPNMSAAPVDVNENEAEQGDGHDGDRPTASTSQAGDIQILDLSGQNPIISYQNQVYYCTWSDMVGTAMFFSKHEAKLEEEALLSTDNFHLINTSRIKLIGQKAKAVEKPGKKRRRQLDHDLSNAIFMDDEYDNGISLLDGKSLGEIRTSNPSVNADIKRQAAFLEKLMNVKRAKGESDNVRTVFTQRKAAPKVARPQGTSDSPAPQRKDFPSLEKEIQELNRLVVRGDASALKRLQDIYSSMEDDAPNLSSQQKSSATPSQTPQNGLNSATMFEQRPQSNN